MFLYFIPWHEMSYTLEWIQKYTALSFTNTFVSVLLVMGILRSIKQGEEREFCWPFSLVFVFSRMVK